ncbi:hypothetical protein SCUCBS95973_007222 [Sporothrix curviconia]|uniref:Aminoglycoside phosphotransferase domain-containing protein n=1 Tax=Sporothrix curviconia TaxID=1260050 RepID=A0ABP0CBL7_9PEZI
MAHMAPEEYLPAPIPLEHIHELLASLGLPKAETITVPDVTATYHAIYRIRLEAPVPADKVAIACEDALLTDNQARDLILRVSGNHLPGIKTRNEVGIMAWVAQQSKRGAALAPIPIPSVVAYDDTLDNPLQHEYTLLSRARGEALCDVWPSLGAEQRDAVFDQIMDLLVTLHGNEEPWSHIGGLNIVDGHVLPARLVDEAFWQTGSLHLWPPGETIDSLNLRGPYPSWPALVAAQVRHYAKLIGLHESLAGLRARLVPRLLAFAELLERPASEHPACWQLAKTRLVLAHKDLHFANLLYSATDEDGKTGRITAVLDWEFSGVVPGPLWNPVRAFLWDAQPDDPDHSATTSTRVAQFADRVRARNDPRVASLVLDIQDYASPQQEAMQDVANYVRALVEVGPRGQRQDRAADWTDIAHKNLDVFGV